MGKAPSQTDSGSEFEELVPAVVASNSNTHYQKSIMLGRTEQNLKLEVFEDESDLAG